MILLIIVVLVGISFLWAVYALHKEERTHGKITHAKHELHKEKILFRRDTH
ncbi:MAG TPA: hypothetical protein PLD54_01840 [Candidatus Levybacteria bacterium]|nr:hypothetical protein [Candidatus Levybacteria bacterium]